MKNNLFFTILNNSFVNNFLFSLWSLKKNNPLDNIDILVVSKEEISEENKKTILKIHPNVMFKVSNKQLFNHKWPFDYDLKLEAYSTYDYNKVLYFDADVVFFKNFTSILKYECDFGAVDYGSYFSATIMLFSKNERTQENLEKFIDIYKQNETCEHDQAIFNKMYLDYFKIPYDYNQMFTNFNIKTAKCLQFPGKVKGLNKEMEDLILEKNQANYSYRLKSYISFKNLKKQFLKEVKINV